MSYREGSTEIIPLTRSVAEDFATMPSWKGERPLNQRRVDLLRDEADRGAFHSPVWSVAKVGNATYRMDGQHSSTMLSQLPKDKFPRNLKVTIREFECSSATDLPILFSKFDRSWSSRSIKERIIAAAAIYRDMPKIGADYIVRGTGGIVFSMNKMSGDKGDQRTEILSNANNRSFICWYYNISTSHLVWRVPVVAAIYEMWQIDREDAEKFLTAIAKGGENKQPIIAIREFLLKAKSTGGNSPGQGSPPRMIYARCIKAWNAWRNGETTSLRYSATADLPKPW